MKKTTFYTEWAYVIGLVMLALGTALMEKADFGLSMVAAPPYILHLKVSEHLHFFTFGMAQYVFQALLVLLLVIVVRRLKISYLFSFVTAVIFGFLLDGAMIVTSIIPATELSVRIILFVVGILCCTFAIALLFRTYIPPEVYELFVMEVSDRYRLNINKCKIVYDYSSLILSIALSFIFFGFGVFRGISYGTVISAISNGLLITMFSKLLNRLFVFKDGLKLKKFFER